MKNCRFSYRWGLSKKQWARTGGGAVAVLACVGPLAIVVRWGTSCGGLCVDRTDAALGFECAQVEYELAAHVARGHLAG